MMNPILLAKKGEKLGHFDNLSRFRTMPLIELIEEIVHKSDPGALHEFHMNRSIFKYQEGPPQVLVEYLMSLKKAAIKGAFSSYNAVDAADKAYDITLEKFNNFPKPLDNTQYVHKKNGEKVKRKEVDCRLYFQAFLKRCGESFNKNPPKSEIEKEMRAARTMQGLVKRSFYRSCLEIKRGLNPFRSRYNWKINEGTLTVYLPLSIEGNKRRAWLEANIENPDPHKKGERERVQAIINRSFVNQRMIQIKDAQNLADDTDWPATWPDDEPGPSLGEIVAQEKADNIDQQRRAVRAIGKKKLKQLVLQIFREIEDKGYADNRLAQGLFSKSTFSRFAGSKWKENGGRAPDLWRNTAQVLSKNPVFREMASGYRDQIHNILNGDNRPNEDRRDQ